MKTKTSLTILAIFALILSFRPPANALDSLTFESLMIDLAFEQYSLEASHQKALLDIQADWDALHWQWENRRNQKKKHYIHFLEQKQALQQQLYQIQNLQEAEGIKIRYRRGIDLIKLLYEKILRLDHHFAGMQTFQNVVKLSNPHSYRAFRDAKDAFEKRKNNNQTETSIQ